MNTTFELNRVRGLPGPRKKNEILDCQGGHLRQFHSQILAFHYSLKYYYSLFIILLRYSLKIYIYSLFFRTSLFTNHLIFCSLFTLIKNFRPLFINHYTPSRPSLMLGPWSRKLLQKSGIRMSLNHTCTSSYLGGEDFDNLIAVSLSNI